MRTPLGARLRFFLPTGMGLAACTAPNPNRPAGQAEIAGHPERPCLGRDRQRVRPRSLSTSSACRSRHFPLPALRGARRGARTVYGAAVAAAAPHYYPPPYGYPLPPYHPYPYPPPE